MSNNLSSVQSGESAAAAAVLESVEVNNLVNSPASQVSRSPSSSSSSSSSSASSSISLIKLDELSSFGATKQARLPALIKLNTELGDPFATVIGRNQLQLQLQQAPSIANRQSNSLPSAIEMNNMTSNSGKTADDIGQTAAAAASSLPMQLAGGHGPAAAAAAEEDKENSGGLGGRPPAPGAPQAGGSEGGDKAPRSLEADDYQMVEMVEDHHQEASGASESNLVGPSLPPHNSTSGKQPPQQQPQLESLDKGSILTLQQHQQPQTSQLGDSLIEMIINLRNENQNLVRALETNNDYVKERLSEFKRCQEESKRREAQFAMERADYEHQVRKLQRQNGVLSERLKSMEVKLKELKLEVSDSLQAAHSSRTSSVAGDRLYPDIGGQTDLSSGSLFKNAALNGAQDGSELANGAAAAAATTMQIDATSGELYNQNDDDDDDGTQNDLTLDSRLPAQPNAPPLSEAPQNLEGQPQARGASFQGMSQEELRRHFDAEKAAFYKLDDPMKQCDKLEQQLNEIGKRDYEICLLQQQLNIYRQDFRLERMANLEAKLQIERLKSDIDRLCLDRLQQQQQQDSTRPKGFDPYNQQPPAAAAAATGGSRLGRLGLQVEGQAGELIGKLGQQLGRRAAKSAAKAAKYAAKQAHREEKAAARAAAAAAAHAHANAHATTGSAPVPGQPEQSADQGQQFGSRHSSHHGHHGGRRRSSRGAGVRSEVVNDLLSTANKAMLTGYKMASTHVNLALDKLSQYEQQQAAILEKNKQQQQQQQTAAGPSNL